MPDQNNSPAVTDLAACIGKDLVVSVNQPNPWGRCYVYPQYVLGETGAEHIDGMRAFPDKGCLPVTTVGRQTSDYVKRELGDIAVLRLNTKPEEQAERYYKRDHNRYFTKFRLPDTDHDSFATLLPLREETAGGGLVEVVGLGEEWDFSTIRDGAFRPYKIPRKILTDVVVVSPRSEFMHRVFGPFRATRDQRGGLMLRALEEFDYQIAAFDYYDWETFLVVNGRKHQPLASFVTMDELRTRLRQSPTKFDWVPDDVLLGMLRGADEARREFVQNFEIDGISTAGDDVTSGSVASEPNDGEAAGDAGIGDTDKPAGGAQISGGLPSGMATIPEDLRLSDIRARRLQQIVSDRTKWDGIFREFDSRMVQSEEELRSTLDSLEQEVATRKAERDRLAEECTSLEARTRDEAERFGRVVSEQADNIAQRLADAGALTHDVLESEMLRSVVARIRRPTSEDEAPLPPVVLRQGEATMSAQDIVGDVYQTLRTTAELKWLTRNDVANLLVCLVQARLTTIVGLPGTGKRSLARALGGSLGLANAETPRLCEVPVGSGWQSYHDLLAAPAYLGFDATSGDLRAQSVFAGLDREARTSPQGEGTDEAPFLLLLGEAGRSVPERYLAPLVGADGPLSARQPRLPLEDGRCLVVPRQFRVIATMDERPGATRPSSPLLDLGWTLVVEPHDIDLLAPYDQDSLAALQSLQPLSMTTLDRAFGYHGEELPEAVASKLLEVIACCRQHGMPLTPRTQRMIRDYVSVASQLMGVGPDEGELTAVDYAVMQKVLPEMASSGARRPELLEALAAIDGLPRTRASLG